MLPNQGRSIQEEMSRFEAEINAARAQQFLMARGAHPGPGVATMGAVPPTMRPHHGVMASAHASAIHNLSNTSKDVTEIGTFNKLFRIIT